MRLLDGTSLDVSVRDAFHRATEIRELIGELPTQSFAITRLLLAILYRTRLGEAFSFDEWRHWYDDGLPLAVIDEYLESYAERFELFGPRPFFQVADLETMSGKRSEVTPLILDLPSNNRLFTNRSGAGAVDLSFAEATRWLVNAHAFDASGIKSGTVGDPRVKGGKGYPLGLAWSGLLGGVLAQGGTLHETLLLNLVKPGFGVEMDGMRDLPPWEDEQADTAQEREDPGPYGPVRLYTWQSRRIRLFTDGERVTSCIVANGDKLTPQNQRIHEPMTAWRYSEPQSKAAKQTTYMPREHLAGRALWRGISALLPRVAAPIAKVGAPAALPPGLVDWLGTLDGEGLIPGRHRVRLRSVGVVYGSNNSVVDDVLADELLLPLALLHERNHSVAVQAEEAVQLTDAGVLALRQLAENLERASGGPGEGARARAGETAYAAFDRPYREWLASLGETSDALDAIGLWKSTAYAILRGLGAELIAQAGPAAWTGRMVTRAGRTDLITTPRAESWFLRSLRKTFGDVTRKDEAA